MTVSRRGENEALGPVPRTASCRISSELDVLTGAVTVRVVGEVDMLVGPELRTALHDALRDGIDVVVDLTGCDFMGSTGLHCLMTTLRRAIARSVPLTIVAPYGTPPRKVIDLSLPGILPLVDELPAEGAAGPGDST